MYNIGICDDGENICASVENMLLKYAEKKAVQVDVQVWYTGEKLRDYLARGNHLDILFLDIELFKMTGIYQERAGQYGVTDHIYFRKSIVRYATV